MNRPSRFLLLALAAVLHTACAEPSAPILNEPGAAVLASVRAGGPDLSQLATFGTPPGVTLASSRQWIGPAGGRLELKGFAIDVPAGAVSRMTQFSIRLPVDPNAAERVVAEFGPHEADFAVPVTIELPYAGTSLEDTPGSTILWWNPATRDWIDMGGSITADGLRIGTTTSHFSLYGAGRLYRSGGVTVSGG